MRIIKGPMPRPKEERPTPHPSSPTPISATATFISFSSARATFPPTLCRPLRNTWPLFHKVWHTDPHRGITDCLTLILLV